MDVALALSLVASAMSRSEFRNTKFIVGLVTIVVVSIGYFLLKGRVRKP